MDIKISGETKQSVSYDGINVMKAGFYLAVGLTMGTIFALSVFFALSKLLDWII